MYVRIILLKTKIFFNKRFFYFLFFLFTQPLPQPRPQPQLQPQVLLR
jgi:hypothetical protein